MLAILKNPYFDPSHISVASEIFLSLLLKNDPCLKNGTLKHFLGNFWNKNEYYYIYHYILFLFIYLFVRLYAAG